MKKLDVDVAVIGAGTAGMVAYGSATKEAERVVLIEGGPLGTTCARVGCMPSKLLIAAAEKAHQPKDSALFGIHIDNLSVNGREVMARVKAERDRFAGFAVEEVEAIPQGSVLHGRARFLGPNRLRVGDEWEVNAKAIVLATGSSPSVPDVLKPLGSRVVVNDDIFNWDDLPESIVVVGTGVIALELGQALARLGVEVTFVGRGDRIGPFSDPDLLESARLLFGEELSLILNAEIISASDTGYSARLLLSTPQGEKTLEAEMVLAATGRSPNLSGLDLENSGLLLNPRGIPLYDFSSQQCTGSSVFMAGDVTGILPIQHEAADEGRIAGRNAARYPNLEPGRRRSHLGIVFSDPQIALVGRRYSDLAPGTYVSGWASFVNQGRSRIMGINRGLLKVYAEVQSGQFLGAEMLGPHAEHLGHLLVWAHQAEKTVQEMLGMPFYHPTIEEAVRTALVDCRRALLKSADLADGVGERLA